MVSVEIKWSESECALVFSGCVCPSRCVCVKVNGVCRTVWVTCSGCIPCLRPISWSLLETDPRPPNFLGTEPKLLVSNSFKNIWKRQKNSNNVQRVVRVCRINDTCVGLNGYFSLRGANCGLWHVRLSSSVWGERHSALSFYALRILSLFPYLWYQQRLSRQGRHSEVPVVCTWHSEKVRGKQMEPAVLLKHVAVRPLVCLPAMQRVAAAQNKRESVEADRVKLFLQHRKIS